ncbi:bifunctional indole-3-glycerol-phosphate synthase TrpC/phosphoribosylanthranilate isomerase TrpF [Lacimicrobium alkaliphilum]|uniref:Multifunctional fusion protein n=1 Tax=Lacimicrobium alkaliphilum TaxID=1526571 RepID=A0ABQ1R3L1_9ALTE|nr:bifunctional indole-3-glycerol-phosphate synthase TrpC/phosphoribosylanthranilate isomerase TrpF [Lacimicrobium alkaliphilum]GGD54848.1 tryptophan biosynthesis protein TrpCF [Lacimicrobium alkaliphilum]
MENVLQKIVADKKQEIEALKQALPLGQFIDDLRPSDKSLYDSLSQPQAGYIFECKKASPSKGLIREHFDLDEILSAYAPFASAISVLTDEKYFQGNYEYLRYVTDRVSQPVLNKDFFIDPYQVYLARYYNADAILLMLSVLDDQQYTQLAELADKYQLDVLTEVSNEEEVQRANKLGARIIGINNRNLRDLSTDLSTTARLAPMLNDNALVISESGIYTHQDVLKLAPFADGFLVGSALMAQENLLQAVKNLVYGKVKICGITTVEDADIVKASGACYAGLIFAEKSPRAISAEQAGNIVGYVPFNYVGVFVDEQVKDVADIARALDLAAVQLHGQEDLSYIQALRELLPPECDIFKACGVTDSLPETNNPLVNRYLLDCQVGNQFGGTGKRFNWALLDNIEDKSGLILAGGLSAENINKAAETGVGMLDVNSGVESAPGHKDATKITQLFKQLRDY